MQCLYLTILDLAGRCGQIGAGVFQCDESGTRTVGRNFHDNALTLRGLANDPQFIGGVRGFAVNLQRALLSQQSFYQCRAEFGANGVGPLDTQCRAVLRDGQGGGGDLQPCAQQKNQ